MTTAARSSAAHAPPPAAPGSHLQECVRARLPARHQEVWRHQAGEGPAGDAGARGELDVMQVPRALCVCVCACARVCVCVRVCVWVCGWLSGRSTAAGPTAVRCARNQHRQRLPGEPVAVQPAAQGRGRARPARTRVPGVSACGLAYVSRGGFRMRALTLAIFLSTEMPNDRIAGSAARRKQQGMAQATHSSASGSRGALLSSNLLHATQHVMTWLTTHTHAPSLKPPRSGRDTTSSR
jgi:hypothetical protein